MQVVTATRAGGRVTSRRAAVTQRRQFLAHAPLGVIAAVAACRGETQQGAPAAPGAPPPGSPTTFNGAPAAGPEVSPSTFEAAEKLVQVQLTNAERRMAATSWRRSMAPLLERPPRAPGK